MLDALSGVNGGPKRVCCGITSVSPEKSKTVMPSQDLDTYGLQNRW